MATAKKPTRSTDPNVRKSPPFSASQFLVGHVSVGNDGNNWIIVESANGIKRWAPYKKSASTSSSTKPATNPLETQQEALDRYNTYISNSSNIYYTLPRTNIVVYIEDSLNIPRYQALIGNTPAIDPNDLDFKKELQDYFAQRFVITNVKVFSGGRADITDFTFEFDPNADSFETRDALNLLDDWLYDQMNVRNGIQKNAIIPATQASSTSSNVDRKLQEFVDQLSANGSLYYTLPKSGVKVYQHNNSTICEFAIELSPGHTIVDSYAKPLKEFIGDQESIQRDVITVNPTGKILLVSFKFINGTKVSIKTEDLDNIDKYLFDTLGIKPSIQSTESTVQEAETKINDIVFSAPVVPVGTEDQRNATDKLVDEFIAKNENNLKKLAVDNVDLLSTIDKTLEFIKAKFGTPAPVTSVTNVATAPSQTQPVGGIDDYKLIQFIGEDGERQVIEFKKFKTGKNANVFKYLIGDVFLDTTSSNADADFVYKQIIGAQEGGVNAGYIHYIDSYPGKIGIGLTWDSRIKKISVGDFEGKIESGNWTSVPGANANLKLLNSQTQASSSSQTAKRSLQIGDIVKIKKSSKYYGIGGSNPKNTEGEIINISSTGSSNPITVRWANAKSNAYTENDLELVNPVQSSVQASTPSSSAISKISKRSYEVGNKVMISANSKFYGAGDSNPANVEGIIIDYDKRAFYPYKVQWSNGKMNSYKARDLVLITTKLSTSTTATPAPSITTTSSGSTTANVGDTVTFYASREKTNLTGIVKSIITGTDGKPYLRINVNGKFYLKQQGSVTKV